MKAWYKCTVSIIGYNPSVTFSFKLCLEMGKNILEEGYVYIQNNTMKKLTKNHPVDIPFDAEKFLERIKTDDKLSSTIYDRIDKKSSFEEVTNIIFPLDNIKSRFIIYDIREIYGCMGCCYESLGQKEHMDCPAGCLHTSQTCSLCIDLKEYDECTSPGSKKRKRE